MDTNGHLKVEAISENVEMFVLANPATLELASKEYGMGNWGISRQYGSRSRPRGTLSQNWRLFLMIRRG